MDDNTLATELLQQLKSSAIGWFIIAMAELAVIAILVILLIFSPIEEYSVEQEARDTDNTQLIGGDYYGETESDVQEKKGSEQETP